MPAKNAVKPGWKQFFARYGFLIVATLVIANIGLVYAIRLNLLAVTCFTAAQVASDSRCLYIWSGHVYEKGTKAAPHMGHTCGMDVTSIMPGSHVAGMAQYLDANKRGDICTAAAPTNTPIPTATRVPTATPIPTKIPTNTPVPTSVPTATPQPTATPLPTATPQPTATGVPTPTSIPPTQASQPTITPPPVGGVPTATVIPATAPSPTDINLPSPTLELAPSPTQVSGENLLCPVPPAVTNLRINCPFCVQ